MRIIIDRFEGDSVFVELPDEKLLQIPRALLDKEVAEGDVLDILVNAKETKARKGDVQGLINELLKESPPFQG